MRGSETTRGAGRRPFIAALRSLRPSVWEHELAKKRFAGNSRVPFMAIVGVEGPPKNQLQARWGRLPGFGRQRSSPGRVPGVHASLFERENASTCLEKDLKIFWFFCLFCECAPMLPTTGA
jgi:hypothetical protein